jgi:polygalacturonase
MTAPGLNSYLYSWYTVREHGAVGNGNDDDSRSIQQTMIRASLNGGGMVIVPAGNYRLGFNPHPAV